jgi:hypothetical protein
MKNKDRSIFRKNIGRALLNRNHDPFLPAWEIDRTSRKAKDEHVEIDLDRQRAIESDVSEYIRHQFSFVVVRMPQPFYRIKNDLEI